MRSFLADTGLFSTCTMTTKRGKTEQFSMDKDRRHNFASVVRSHLPPDEKDREVAGALSREHGRIVRVDQQWTALNPKWGKNDHKGEHAMLYGIIQPDEDLECIIGGSFGPDLGQAKVGDSFHRGIIVATDRRVLMVDKGLFGSTEVAEMPYHSIEAITRSTGMFAAGLRITGRGTMHFRIEKINPKEAAARFADCVQDHLTGTGQAGPDRQGGAVTPVVTSAASEVEALANLLDRGILTQEEFDAKKKELLGL